MQKAFSAGAVKAHLEERRQRAFFVKFGLFLLMRKLFPAQREIEKERRDFE